MIDLIYKTLLTIINKENQGYISILLLIMFNMKSSEITLKTRTEIRTRKIGDLLIQVSLT